MTRGYAGRWELTDAERAAVNRFIFGKLLVQGPPPLNAHSMPGITREQWSESYQQWGHGGHAWLGLEQGGTGQMAALCWYHHIHRPGSREWRPSKIIPAFVAAAVEYQRAGSAPTPETPAVGSPPLKGD